MQVFSGLVWTHGGDPILLQHFAALLDAAPNRSRSDTLIAERLLAEAYRQMRVSFGIVIERLSPLSLDEMREALAESIESADGTPNWELAKALDIIRRRHSEADLTARDVAGEMGRSPSYVSRLFARKTGKGVRHHLRAIRLAKASGLLGSTRLSIKEVAAAVGFSSTSECDRQFRRVYGATPTDFRDRCATRREGPCAPEYAEAVTRW